MENNVVERTFEELLNDFETEEEREEINLRIRNADTQLYLLYVSGEAYSASEFENTYGETRQIKIIRMMIFTDSTDEILNHEDDGEIGVKLYRFGRVDPSFISFVRDEIQDYDLSKHRNFYEFTPSELLR